MPPPAPGRPLSPREIQILHHIARGHSRASISTALGIAEATVKSHLQRISRALHARNTAHSVAIAIRRGLLPGGTAITPQTTTNPKEI
ncbi:response regulator transcription factor [Streptomyces griseoincarnatus]